MSRDTIRGAEAQPARTLGASGEDHNKDVAGFQRVAKTAEDAELKARAAKTLADAAGPPEAVEDGERKGQGGHGGGEHGHRLNH
jgi:hypothetical protein